MAEQKRQRDEARRRMRAEISRRRKQRPSPAVEVFAPPLPSSATTFVNSGRVASPSMPPPGYTALPTPVPKLLSNRLNPAYVLRWQKLHIVNT